MLIINYEKGWIAKPLTGELSKITKNGTAKAHTSSSI
ncbi:MAG: hypothetical protein ACJAYB_000534 [Psychromonas sp.]|jgi:hypothetical protein